MAEDRHAVQDCFKSMPHTNGACAGTCNARRALRVEIWLLLVLGLGFLHRSHVSAAPRHVYLAMASQSTVCAVRNSLQCRCALASQPSLRCHVYTLCSLSSLCSVLFKLCFAAMHLVVEHIS